MDKLISILKDLHPDVDFETEEGLIDKMILDSFDIVTIAAEVDLQFGVQLPPQALTPENFNSARALYGLIRQLAEG